MKCYSFSEAQRMWSAPAFSLPGVHGEPVALGQQRGRSNLVLVFSDDGDCRPCAEGLRRFGEQQAAYRAHDAQVWAVLPDDLPALAALGDELVPAWPRLLADPSGATRQAYAALLPEPPADGEVMVFVLDRFGAPQAAFVTAPPGDPELHEQVLDWLAGIELECPE